jgi:Kinesin motor domain
LFCQFLQAEDPKARDRREGVFTFSKVFDESVDQKALFASILEEPVTKAVTEGQNTTLFAYGMTNAGKTYTITGNEPQPGLLPGALKHVFQTINSLDSKKKSSSSAAALIPAAGAAKALPAGTKSSSFVVLVSYLEIYNENCNDLFAPIPTDNAAKRAHAASLSSSSSAAPAASGTSIVPTAQQSKVVIKGK